MFSGVLKQARHKDYLKILTKTSSLFFIAMLLPIVAMKNNEKQIVYMFRQSLWRTWDYLIFCLTKYKTHKHTGKFKILVVQNTDLLIIILPKIDFDPAQNTKLHLSLLCQFVQNTGGPEIQNTDGARSDISGFLLVNLDLFKVLVNFPGLIILLPEMMPRNNVVYQIQNLTIFWTSRKICILKSPKPTACRPASPANM